MIELIDWLMMMVEVVNWLHYQITSNFDPQVQRRSSRNSGNGGGGAGGRYGTGEYIPPQSNYNRSSSDSTSLSHQNPSSSSRYSTYSDQPIYMSWLPQIARLFFDQKTSKHTKFLPILLNQIYLKIFSFCLLSSYGCFEFSNFTSYNFAVNFRA